MAPGSAKSYTPEVSGGFELNLSKLPSLPTVVLDLQKLISSDLSNHSQIAAIISKDQALTSRVLKLVNSSYYSIPGGVADIKKALIYLGFNTLSQVVLSASIVNIFKVGVIENFSIDEFWRHSFSVAIGSECLMRLAKRPGHGDAFTCGLLHDIGKLIQHELSDTKFKELIGTAASKKISLLEVEIQLGLQSHVDLGAVTVEAWGLPSPIAEVIRHHGLSPSDPNFPKGPAGWLTCAVSAANDLCRANGFGHSGNFSGDSSAQDYLSVLFDGPFDFETTENAMIAAVEKSGDNFHDRG